MKRPNHEARQREVREVFFDIHCHAFNLSHAGLLAFLNRLFLNNSLTFEDLLEMRLFRMIRRFMGGRGNIFRLSWKRIRNFSIGLIVILIFGFSLFLLGGALSGSGMALIWKVLLMAFMAFLLIALIPVVILFCLKSRPVTRYLSRLINLLSLIENDLGRQLLLLEMDILRFDKNARALVKGLEKNPDSRSVRNHIREEWAKTSGKRFRIGGRAYRKFLLTPLIMDFNSKGYSGLKAFDKIHYSLPARKPVIDQVIDLHFGIRDYWRRSPFRILEIHPFMGLNSQNYDLGMVGEVTFKPNAWIQNKAPLRECSYYLETRKLLAMIRKPSDQEMALLMGMAAGTEDQRVISDLVKRFTDDANLKNNLAVMLEKYFSSYQNRYRFIRDTFKTSYLGRMPLANPPSSGVKIKAETGNIGRGFFAGIKVYPPLGFDPWPNAEETEDIPDVQQRRAVKEKTETELRKVKFLYAYCQERRIPITTHCGDSGFQVEDREKSWKYTSPERWEKVLVQFPKLKLNFAHFGSQVLSCPRVWRDKIIDLITRFDHVYADFSYRGVTADYYESLAGLFKRHPELRERLLFGTDFLINLIDTESYEEYLKIFIDCTSSKTINSTLSDIQKPPFIISDRIQFCEVNPERFLFG